MFAAEDAPLSRYIQRVRSLPTLSKEEEVVCAIAAKDGDPQATTRLIEANLRYVVAIALQYRRYGLRVAELIAEGNVGLMMAVKKYDTQKGTRFVTYAGYWIRAYILDYVVRSSSLVSSGSGPFRSKIFFRLRRERARLSNRITDSAERLHLLAKSFHTTPEKMESMLQRIEAKDWSLDAPYGPDSEWTLLDRLASNDTNHEEAYINLEESDARESHVQHAMQGLDQRERFIVQQRFFGDQEMSLAAIGRKLGVSRERARQLEARAKEKIRERLMEYEFAA